MLHACVARFDVTEILKNFWFFGVNKALEQLQQFAKSTWHSRIFAKTTKNSLQQVGKTT